jgi:ferritin-like metal-binding protein YciE
LKELHSVENQLAKAIPEMARQANAEDQWTNIEGQSEKAKEHVARL